MDGGLSWVKWGILPAAPITALAFDPQDPATVYAGAVQQDATLRVFKSFDGGVSWTSVSLGSAGVFYVDKLVVDPKNPDTIYALTGCDAYYCDTPPNYKSTDGGATWAKWELPEFSTYLTIDAQGTIYAATGSRLFQSVDRGASWSAVTNSGLIAGISSLAVDPRNPNHLFAGTGAGVFEITLVPEEQ
jgi:hypothetical protein